MQLNTTKCTQTRILSGILFSIVLFWLFTACPKRHQIAAQICNLFTFCSLCLGPIGNFCIGDGEKNNYTRDASRCLAILSINTSRLFTEGSLIPLEHRLMLVNFHRECIGDAKKSPVGPSH